MMPTTDYLPLFAPALCTCGEMPHVQEMPNYPADEQWQVYCHYKHPRAFGATMDEAISNYNGGLTR